MKARPLFAAPVFCVVTLAMSGGHNVGASTAEENKPAITLSWHNAGDSYASGEGVSGNVGSCAQSNKAFGPVSAEIVARKGWAVTPQVFTACTGHLVEDFLNVRPGSDKGSLASWAKEQGLTDGRSDVLTMSFGGNDIGFADIVMGCLRLPDGDWQVGRAPDGCEESEEELKRRVDALVAPTAACTGGRHDARRDASFSWDCDLLLDDKGTSDTSDDRRGSIADFYRLLVSEHLTPRGRLVVVGYPSLFAPTDEWPIWDAFMCAGISRGDAQKLQRLAQYLDSKLREAVTNADGGSGRITYISRFDEFRNGSHELCGKGADWVNGISTNRGPGIEIPRIQTSFHPNALGHAAVADSVAAVVASVDWSAPLPVTRAELENLALPGEICQELELVPGDHRLAAGRYVARSGEGNEVAISTGDFAVGDLDGDGVDDGALSVGCANGIADHIDMVFVVLAESRTVEAVPLTDDRSDLAAFDPRRESLTDVDSVDVASGELRVAMRWTFMNDAICCGTTYAVGRYVVSGSSLARSSVAVASDLTRTERLGEALNAGDADAVNRILSTDSLNHFADSLRRSVKFSTGECWVGEILDDFRICEIRETETGFIYQLEWDGGLGPELEGDEARVASVLIADH